MAAKKHSKGRTARRSHIPLDVEFVVRRLQQVHSVVLVAVLALERQNCDCDDEIALALKRSAADPLWGEIERLGKAATAGL